MRRPVPERLDSVDPPNSADRDGTDDRDHTDDRAAFLAIQEAVVACRRCPRLVEWREAAARAKVRRFRDCDYWGRPVPALGEPGAALLVVGLAPAAHGGNRTGRMFTGDRSGDWLFEALHRFGFASQARSIDRGDGLALRDCVITAAARCAPPDNKPAPVELENCRVYLDAELRLFRRVRVVVCLGRIALDAFVAAWRRLGRDLPVRRPEFGHGAEWRLAGGIALLASYHPSQQNTQTGRLTRAMFYRVFRRARKIVTVYDFPN